MGKRVFVGNLPFSATEDQLRELFSAHGEVTTAEIVKDKFTERSRGFAFVEMATDEAAAAAVAALNQHQMDGRPLTVNEARARTESRGPRGGGNRGGGEGGNRW
jgi:RNA recognition motif-containing protein